MIRFITLVVGASVIALIFSWAISYVADHFRNRLD